MAYESSNPQSSIEFLGQRLGLWAPEESKRAKFLVAKVPFRADYSRQPGIWLWLRINGLFRRIPGNNFSRCPVVNPRTDDTRLARRLPDPFGPAPGEAVVTGGPAPYATRDPEDFGALFPDSPETCDWWGSQLVVRELIDLPPLFARANAFFELRA